MIHSFFRFLLPLSSWKQKNPRNFPRKMPGETILEVMLAVVILVLVLSGTFSALNTATFASTNVKNRTIATNLAREAIEAVRNVRDTNWIKYAGNRRENWLCLQDPCTTAGNTITAQTFVTVDIARDPIVSVPATQSVLDKDDADYATTFVDYQVKQFAGLLGHSTSPSAFDTKFYRQTEITPVTADICPGSDTCSEVRADLTVRVQWEEPKGIQTVTLSTRLYDFFERETY